MRAEAIVRKTAKGIEEMSSRTWKLPARERNVLVMIDGKLTVAGVLAKGKVLGDVAGYLAHLIEHGFVELDSHQATPVSAAPPPLQDPDVGRFASKFLSKHFGPQADDLALRLESARTAVELDAALASAREMVQYLLGRQRADQFWAEVTARRSGR